MPETLFETIGGNSTILAAVNEFYRRVLADPTLSPFFKTVDMDSVRARQNMFLTMILGGRIQDSREQIHAAHEGSRTMGLNDSHFNAFLNHFRAALEDVGVAPDALNKVMTLLEGTRSAVLER